MWVRRVALQRYRTAMPHRYSSSDDTHAMVARIAPAIIELLSDGLPRSRHEILEALAPRHATDEVERTFMRLAVTGRLVETKHKYSLSRCPRRTKAELSKSNRPAASDTFPITAIGRLRNAALALGFAGRPCRTLPLTA